MSNSTEATSSFHCISGVDIAAKDFTVAIILNGSKPKLEPTSFKQEAEGFTRFITRLQATGVPPQQQLIVMEATGPYWVALAVALAQATYNVSVANPAQVHFFAKAQRGRAKSDKLDAQTLAQFGQIMQPKLANPPPQFYHELRQRISQRESLLKFLNQVNIINSTPSQGVPPSWRACGCSYKI